MIVNLEDVAAGSAIVWVTGRGVYRVRSVNAVRYWLILGATVFFSLGGRACSSSRLYDGGHCVAIGGGADWGDDVAGARGEKQSIKREAASV